MEQNHPVLNKFIFQKLKEAGLSKKELCVKAGYKNFSKGLNQLSLFESTGKIKTPLLKKIIDIVKIDSAKLNQVLYDEVIYIKRQNLNNWIDYVILPHEKTSLCNKCVFLIPTKIGRCNYPLLYDTVLNLYRMKWAGFIRPESCPLGYKKQNYEI